METNQLAPRPAQNVSLVDGIFSSLEAFNLGQRMATALSTGTIVPKDYQGNVGNCMIAVEIAARLHTSPLLVMQNLYIIQGRPAWSTQYVVAMIEATKRYRSSLHYELTGKGDAMACYAWAERQDGSKDVGPTITMQMAKAEGWLGKNGSKWATMPEVMIRYRAASFFGRLYCPDALLGIYSVDEVREIAGEFVEPLPVDVEAKEPISIPEAFDAPPAPAAPAPEPAKPADEIPLPFEETPAKPANATAKPRAGQQQFGYGKPQF
jgi:hypothetical protein